MGDSHGRGLEIREEESKSTCIRRMHHFRTIQALLALILLKEKVIATVSVERQLTASGLADSLLCAAVGLELWHTDEGL